MKPEKGTRVVHKDDHAKTQGPLWQVSGVNPDPLIDKPITLVPVVGHKMNKNVDPFETRRVTEGEFDSDYVKM